MGCGLTGYTLKCGRAETIKVEGMRTIAKMTTVFWHARPFERPLPSVVPLVWLAPYTGSYRSVPSGQTSAYRRRAGRRGRHGMKGASSERR